MDSKELYSEMLSLVRKNDFTEWALDGIRIWPFVLYVINREYKSIHYSSWDESILDKAKKELSKSLSLQIQQYRDKKNSIKISRSTDVVILTSSTRRVKTIDSYYDRITDPFYNALTNLGYNCITLEWTYDHKYNVPRYNPSCFIQNDLDYCVAKGLLKRKNYDTSSFKGIEDVNSIFSKIKANANLYSIIKRDWSIILEIKELFIKKLSRGTIKLAFYYPYYSLVSFGFVLACKKLGITTVEIQHAYFRENNVQYSALGSSPANGYELLPDYFWAWDKTSKTILTRPSGAMQRDASRVHIGSNLWNNMWLEPYKNRNSFYKYYQKLIERELVYKNDHPRLLFTLTYSCIIPEWLSELIQDSAKKLIWFVRFHHNTAPSDVEKIKSILGTSNIEYRLSNELPLPILLTMTDIHVTIESSAVGEAEEFGKPSIITTEAGAAKLEDFISKGTADAAFSKERFWEHVNRFLNGSHPETNSNHRQVSNMDALRIFLKEIRNKSNSNPNYKDLHK